MGDKVRMQLLREQIGIDTSSAILHHPKALFQSACVEAAFPQTLFRGLDS